ncbi:OLC1v1025055C1 [Oldenlandia corymbosa var. corymbosa]|uniref:OLC1v1025055C1 n=1 Tax=Oldenlandia corymbosa var. corymbosa TaxID=529605 RepID=A0AAV1C5I7_OLDCO|nr:OLC1v1025055C1 [Oldenlandia corymbosa var. corymbosa]
MATPADTTIIARDQSHGRNINEDGTAAITIIMVPYPSQGHLNPLLHLAGLISSGYRNIPVHYVTTPAHTRKVKSRVQGWDPDSISNLHFHGLRVSSHEVSPPLNPTAFFGSFHLRGPVFELMKQLSSVTRRRLVVIYDVLMAYVVQDLDSIPNTEAYAFSAFSALFNYSFMWELQGKPEQFPELQLLQLLPEIKLPPRFSEFMRLQLGTKVNRSGTLFNSSRAIEGPFLDYVREPINTFGSDRIWAVGPLNPLHEEKGSKKDKSDPRHYCLDWLDKQAPNSVILVSFGSATTLSDEEIKVTAIGLEESQQRATVLVTKVLKVGMPVLEELLASDHQAKEIHVTSKDIKNAVRSLMDSEEGEKIRLRAE